MGRKISDICLKQGQGMRGRAAPPHPGIYRVTPPPLGHFPQLSLCQDKRTIGPFIRGRK